MEVPCPWTECDWRMPDGRCWMGGIYPRDFAVKDHPCIDYIVKNPCQRCKNCVDFYCVKKDFYPNRLVCADTCEFARLIPLDKLVKRRKK